MPTAVLSPAQGAPKQESQIPCDSQGCARMGRGDHPATHEVLLLCGHVRYWCELSIRECDEYLRGVTRMVARAAADAGDALVETTEGPMPMRDIVIMAVEALHTPQCAWCNESAAIVAAVPISRWP